MEQGLVKKALEAAGYHCAVGIHCEGQVKSHGRWCVRSSEHRFEVYLGYKDNAARKELTDTLVTGSKGHSPKQLDKVADLLRQAQIKLMVDSETNQQTPLTQSKCPNPSESVVAPGQPTSSDSEDEAIEVTQSGRQRRPVRSWM